ncbi:MAG: ABC transporter ATP-binding protein [Bacteroidota bacterium]
MIEVKNVTKLYAGKAVVDGLSFSIGKGETLVILGTSGSGKTTMLKMINRLIEPSSGQILINGVDNSNVKLEELRRQIGYVIQSIGLFPHYTIEQNIGLIPTLLGWEKDKIQKRVLELIKLLGLDPEMMPRKPENLSGGQQQRVGIARALAADPPIVLLDEPFGALDPITRHQIQLEFKNLEAILNTTMVLVTHDVVEAITLGDRICLMDEGRIQQIGTAKELIFRPANDFVKHFFNANSLQLALSVLSKKDITPYLPEVASGISSDDNTMVLSLMEEHEDMSEHILHAFYQASRNMKK